MKLRYFALLGSFVAPTVAISTPDPLPTPLA